MASSRHSCQQAKPEEAGVKAKRVSQEEPQLLTSPGPRVPHVSHIGVKVVIDEWPNVCPPLVQFLADRAPQRVGFLSLILKAQPF
jgi:hypothetical protein